MKKIILILLLFAGFAISQQINYTWGYETDGDAYVQTGKQNMDSTETLSIVFDMQDYYPLDFNPLFSDDSVIIINSNRYHYGTFWYHIDLENATDSSAIMLEAFPGNMWYYPGSGDRIETANINFSTTATTLIDTSSYTTNDVQWTAVNVYLSDTEGKILPPEFIKLTVKWMSATNDSIDFYWNFAYPAVYEREQDHRTSLKSDARKRKETLH